jgi:hypothetical protein
LRIKRFFGFVDAENEKTKPLRDIVERCPEARRRTSVAADPNRENAETNPPMWTERIAKMQEQSHSIGFDASEKCRNKAIAKSGE